MKERQTATKAIASLLAGGVGIAAIFGTEIDAEIVAPIASLLGAALVYFVPNRAKVVALALLTPGMLLLSGCAITGEGAVAGVGEANGAQAQGFSHPVGSGVCAFVAGLPIAVPVTVGIVLRVPMSELPSFSAVGDLCRVE